MLEHYLRDDTIVILAPECAPEEPSDLVKSFSDLAHSNAPSVIGQIPDIGEFSRSLGWAPDTPKQEFFIKSPGTHFVLPRELEQFVPTLKEMIKNHYSTNGKDGFCILGVQQAIIHPDQQESGAFVHAHKDLNAKRLLTGEEIPNCSVMIACDSLATGFSTPALSPDDIHRIEEADDPDKELREILRQVKYQSYEAGTITRHDITTPHALANPDAPTLRTVLIAVFTMDADLAKALSTTPGLQQFDRTNWVDVRKEFIPPTQKKETPITTPVGP